jgi:hypothetical protein
MGHQLEGLCEKGVTSQNRNRLSKNLMASGFAPSEIVIVDGGEIVVNEGVGVNHFKRTGERQDCISLASNRVKGRDGQNGADPLASGEKAVTDRLPQRRREIRVLWEILFECGIDDLFFFAQVTSNIHQSGFIPPRRNHPAG